MKEYEYLRHIHDFMEQQTALIMAQKLAILAIAEQLTASGKIDGHVAADRMLKWALEMPEVDELDETVIALGDLFKQMMETPPPSTHDPVDSNVVPIRK